jgi:hypothetical protein
MRIEISGVEYSDLEILSEAEIPLMDKLFGKPKNASYDSVLGDSFNSKFIGYIPDEGGELQKPAVIKKLLLSDVQHTRKVFLCEYKGKYWFSLGYGYKQHLDFPRSLEGNEQAMIK